MKSTLACLVLVAMAVGSNGLPLPSEVTKMPLTPTGQLPIVGLGTLQVNDPKELERALDAALEAGYRHIDTASIYGNENIIGNVLKRWLQSGKVTRQELFITSKLPVYGNRPADVPVFLKKSLADLQLDYVDLYLFHVPFGVKRDGFVNGVVVPNGIDKTTDHVAIWKAMEAEVDAGRAKAIGLSNFNETQIERIIKNARIAPTNLEVEIHLYHQQKALVDFCKKNGLTVTAYSPLGSPGSTWLSQLSGKPLPNLLSLPVVTEIAARRNKSPAQVLLRHTIQRGIVVIPKSTNPKRINENIDIFDFSLTAEDMASLDALDKGWEGKIFHMKFFAGAETHPEYPWPALI